MHVFAEFAHREFKNAGFVVEDHPLKVRKIRN